MEDTEPVIAVLQEIFECIKGLAQINWVSSKIDKKK